MFYFVKINKGTNNKLIIVFPPDRSWWARLACLDFAQPLLFYGLAYLCAEPARAERAERLALQLMRDPRLEVR